MKSWIDGIEDELQSGGMPGTLYVLQHERSRARFDCVHSSLRGISQVCRRRASAQRNDFLPVGIEGALKHSHPPVDNFPGDTSPDDAAVCELLQSGFRYALALAHHREDAEDLTQTAWVRLCARYGRVTSRPVLLATIRNLFIDRCRRARVIPFEPWDEASLPVAAVEPISPGCIGDLDKLLGDLRAEEREAVYLHHVEGHTAEEIGMLTHQPRNTVLSLLSRALHKLRASANSPTRRLRENNAITDADRSSSSSHERA